MSNFLAYFSVKNFIYVLSVLSSKNRGENVYLIVLHPYDYTYYFFFYEWKIVVLLRGSFIVNPKNLSPIWLFYLEHMNYLVGFDNFWA